MAMQIASTTRPTGAAIVRAALEARTGAEAAHVNDMIALSVGERFERFVGDTVVNFGPLSTSGSYDHKALEPLTNMHDAILERYARERFGNDLSTVPYKTPRDATAALLGHLRRDQQAELARIDIYESDPPARQTKRVTLAYRDKGCGIGSHYVADSIFRLGSAHKQANLWQQGAFGMGATTCYPNAEAVVLVSRRPPCLLGSGEADVITVAVAEWQQHQKGRGIYYLVTESVDDNPQAATLAIPAADVPEFEPGTYLALISYTTEGFHTGRNDRTSLEFIINTRLWRPCLPVTLMNHVAKGDHAKTHQGRGPQFDSASRPDRREFHDVMPFAMNGITHHLPIDVYYFEGGPSGDVGSMRNFVAQGHSALLLANGQVHKHWDSQELRRRADRLTKLYDRILIAVDLDQIPVDERTSRLFTPDRVDFVKSPDAVRLQDSLAAMLNSWVELRELNNELVRKAIQNRGNDRSTLEIAEKIRAQLAFRGGVSLVGSKKEGGEAPPKRRWADAELWPDPTTLEGPDTIHAVAGKIRFISYQVNAANDFFASGRGKLELTCDNPRIGPAELVAGGELRGGMIRASLLVPDDIAIGTTATITAAIRGWGKAAGGIGEDLEWVSRLEVVDGAKRPPKPEPKGRKKTMASKGSQVAVLWRSNIESDSWNGGVPGEIEPIEASVLAAEREEYRDLAELGSEQIPTVVLNEDFTPLKDYEVERVTKLASSGGDAPRDRYAVGVGVGLLVLEERNRKLEKDGKQRPDDTLVERQAVARAALALMPDFDKLIKEAGLESE
jgi:hypothetical protein